MGSQLQQKALKSVFLLFQADLGTNLVKQGENVKGRPSGFVARQSARTVRRGPEFESRSGHDFSSPVTCISYPTKYFL